MDIIMNLIEEAGEFTDSDIREEVDNIVFAGHDTISTVMTYAFILLGSYEHVQERAYKELLEVFGNSDREVNKDDISNLPYIDAVLKETMRLYPVAPVVARHVDRDVKLKNFTMPAGSSCFMFFYGMHHHPVWGPDAAEFKPERWLSPDTLPKNPNAYAGFSIGRRYCLGKVYAMMSMKILVSHVLRRYRIKADITKLQMKLETILKPYAGHHINIERRT